MNHDVFNGDADGICALHQLRLAFPATNNLVTGVKRDLSLLRHVEAVRSDDVTVLDLALSQNRDALLALLDKGVSVRYFDHHVAKDVPAHPNLSAMIDTSPHRAHAVLTQRSDGAFVVSVRVPLTTNNGADVLCSRFATGGGRKGAAGINRLPQNELPQFMQAFDEVFSGAPLHE